MEPNPRLITEVIDADPYNQSAVYTDINEVGEKPKTLELHGEITKLGRLGYSEISLKELKHTAKNTAVLWLPAEVEPESAEQTPEDDKRFDMILGYLAVGREIHHKFKLPLLKPAKSERKGVLLRSLLEHTEPKDLLDTTNSWLWLYTKKRFDSQAKKLKPKHDAVDTDPLQQQLIETNGLIIDPERETVSLPGLNKEVKISGSVLHLAVYMAQRPNKLMDFDELKTALGDADANDGRVRHAIRQVGARFGTLGVRDVIVNERGKGYMLVDEERLGDTEQ